MFEAVSKKIVSYVFSQDAILLLKAFIDHNSFIVLVFQLLKSETRICNQVSFCLTRNSKIFYSIVCAASKFSFETTILLIPRLFSSTKGNDKRRLVVFLVCENSTMCISFLVSKHNKLRHLFQ